MEKPTFKTNLNRKVSPNTLYVVDEMESERGWGRSLLRHHFFLTKEDAQRFESEYNQRNNKDFVPDYYTFCQYNGEFPIADVMKLKQSVIIHEFNENDDPSSREIEW